MNRLSLLLTFLLAWLAPEVSAQTSDSALTRVVIETTKGNIVAELFNDTPIHRDNFLEKADRHLYDGVLFHRVIPAFMIQAGDSASRSAKPGELLGETKESKSLPAEFRFPAHYHQAGALCMAREGDEDNPQRESSSWQFYIVTGNTFTEASLDKVQQRLDRETGGTVKFTPEIRQTYLTHGGAPHLDGTYTVFGQVVSGYDVMDEIQFSERDANNRPLEDIRIISVHREE